MATDTLDISTDPGYDRATDPDVAQAGTSIQPRVAAQAAQIVMAPVVTWPSGNVVTVAA